MFLSPKLELIFSIITTFDTMQYKFKNEAVSKMPKKLVIIAINLLVCYLIVKINYIDLLLITKMIILYVEFKVLRETSFASNNIAKPAKKTKLDQYVPK